MENRYKTMDEVYEAAESGRITRPGDGNYNIYFIANQMGQIKIGMTNKLKQRVKQMQTGCAMPLVVYDILWTDGEVRARFLEHRLHRMFEKFRTNGEWFEIEPVATWLEWICTQRNFNVGEFLFVHTDEFFEINHLPPPTNITLEEFTETQIETVRRRIAELPKGGNADRLP